MGVCSSPSDLHHPLLFSPPPTNNPRSRARSRRWTCVLVQPVPEARPQPAGVGDRCRVCTCRCAAAWKPTAVVAHLKELLCLCMQGAPPSTPAPPLLPQPLQQRPGDPSTTFRRFIPVGLALRSVLELRSCLCEELFLISRLSQLLSWDFFCSSNPS